MYLMVLPLKLLIQTLTLIWILLVRVPAPDFFLVQVSCFIEFSSVFYQLDFRFVVFNMWTMKSMVSVYEFVEVSLLCVLFLSLPMEHSLF